MNNAIVLLVCSLTLILGVRASVSENCDQVYDDCFEKAYYIVGPSVFDTIAHGAKEPFCVYRSVYKSCVAEHEQCKDHPRMAARIKYLDDKGSKIKCDNLTLNVRGLESDYCFWRHLVCYRRVKTEAGTSGFQKSLKGDVESVCKLGSAVKSCLQDDSEQCLKDENVPQGFKLLLAQSRPKCD